METEKCDNILVRGVNWIGDAVMTMPAMRAIRRAHPRSRITLLVKPWVSPLFERDPAVDRIMIYSDEYSGVTGKIRLSRMLRKEKFCRAILLQNAIDAALLSVFAGIPERIGYSRDGRGMLLTRAIAADERARGLHHTEYYINLLNEAGFAAEMTKPWMYLSLDERLGARQKLAGMRRPLVGMNPGASFGSAKRWPPERFAAVAGRIISELRGSVVVFGGPSETEIAEDIRQSLLRGDALSGADGASLDQLIAVLAGKTDLRGLASLISECDLLITNDSGPMHIGYAVGTPLVAIFGSTSPELTGPVGPGNIVIRKHIACSPCFDRTCGKGHLKCMELIEADEVFDAAARLLPSRKAVFFDRDGTLCRDAGYLSRMEDFDPFPDVAELERLRARGYLLIGISNQSGIARGLVSDSFVRQVNEIFVKKYGFDAFHYCPHHPDDHCACRKPEPGLVRDAALSSAIDLRVSFVVGDKDSDMILAKSAGARGILVKTGQDRESRFADYEAFSLGEAVDIVMREQDAR